MKVYGSLYRTLPAAQRAAIIANAMAQAIATNDRSLAPKGAKFARAGWTNKYPRGMVAHESNMLAFYRSRKSTANFAKTSSKPPLVPPRCGPSAS